VLPPQVVLPAGTPLSPSRTPWQA